MSCENANHKYEQGTDHECMVVTQYGVKTEITDSACNGSADINILLEHDRCLTGKDITQDTASDTGDHTEESTEKWIFLKTGRDSFVDTGDCEKTETDGIDHIQKIIISL